WKSLWGEGLIELRPAGEFVDATGAVMPCSRGEVLQAVPFRRIDLYWRLARNDKKLLAGGDGERPAPCSLDNSVRVTLKIEQAAPSVQCVSVRVRWKSKVYPTRGKWVGLAKAKWTDFLCNLEAECRKLTTV